jgi:hypothetical protein
VNPRFEYRIDGIGDWRSPSYAAKRSVKSFPQSTHLSSRSRKNWLLLLASPIHRCGKALA